MRVLQWIVNRVKGKVTAVECPLGWVPKYEDLSWEGLDFKPEKFNTVMTVDREIWKKELTLHEELFNKLYDKLPKEFIWTRELILSSLWRSPEKWALAHE